MKDIKILYIKYKLLVWPIFSGIASLIILSLVIIPQILGYLETKGKITEIGINADKIEAKAKGLQSIDPDISSENLAVAYTILPSDRNVPAAISILQGLVNRSGLALKNTSYSAVSKGSTKDSFMLNVTVVGQISGIRNFLIGLKDAGRVFQVESINVRFQKVGSLVEAEIPITVYFHSGQVKAGSVDKEPPKLTEQDEQFLRNLAKIINSPSTRSVSGESTASSVPVGKTNPFD